MPDMIGVQFARFLQSEQRSVDQRAAASRMTSFSRVRIAISVKCGDATAMAANRMARIIQNLAATRLFVMGPTAENFMRVCP